MVETPANRKEDETIGRVFVILGTSHDIQWRPKDATPSECKLIDGLDSVIRASISKYKIKLIAEETLGPNSPPTVACQIAKEKMMRYVEIEMLPHEAEAAGIASEVRRLNDPTTRDGGNDESRWRIVDDRRENSWLDKIQVTMASPVLVVCGYKHTRSLATKARDRRCAVAEEVFFPLNLRDKLT